MAVSLRIPRGGRVLKSPVRNLGPQCVFQMSSVPTVRGPNVFTPRCGKPAARGPQDSSLQQQARKFKGCSSSFEQLASVAKAASFHQVVVAVMAGRKALSSKVSQGMVAKSYFESRSVMTCQQRHQLPMASRFSLEPSPSLKTPNFKKAEVITSSVKSLASGPNCDSALIMAAATCSGRWHRPLCINTSNDCNVHFQTSRVAVAVAGPQHIQLSGVCLSGAALGRLAQMQVSNDQHLQVSSTKVISSFSPSSVLRVASSFLITLHLPACSCNQPVSLRCRWQVLLCRPASPVGQLGRPCQTASVLSDSRLQLLSKLNPSLLQLAAKHVLKLSGGLQLQCAMQSLALKKVALKKVAQLQCCNCNVHTLKQVAQSSPPSPLRQRRKLAATLFSAPSKSGCAVDDAALIASHTSNLPAAASRQQQQPQHGARLRRSVSAVSHANLACLDTSRPCRRSGAGTSAARLPTRRQLSAATATATTRWQLSAAAATAAATATTTATTTTATAAATATARARWQPQSDLVTAVRTCRTLLSYLADICTSGGALREQRREGSVLPCGPASPARSPSTEFGALLSEFRLLLNSNINNNNSNKKSWLSKFKPFLLQPAANHVLRLSVSAGLHVHSARHCEPGPGLLMKLSFASPALHLSSQRCLTALKQVSERLVGSCRCRQRQKLATKPLSQFKTGCDLDDAALLSSTAAHYAQQARAHVVAAKFSSSKANFRNGDAVVAKSRVKPACWQLFLHHGPSYRVQPVQGVTPDAATVGLPMHHLWSHCHLAALLQGGGPAGKTASLKAHQATHVPSVLSAHQATQLLSCPLSFHSPVQEGFKLQGRLSRLQVRWVETATPTTTPSTAGYSLAREGASAWAGQTRSRSIIPSLRAANSQCWALRAAPRNEFFCRRCPTFAKSPVRSQSLSTQNELLDHTPIVRCQTLCKAGAQDLLKESFGTNDSIAESAVRQSCSKSQAGFCSGHPSQICLSIPMAFSSPNIPVRKHVIMDPRSSTSRTMPHLCDRTCCQQPARALNWSLGMSPGRNYSPACVLGLNRDATCPCISGASLHATCSGPAMLCKHSLLSKVVKVASLLPQASPVTTTTTALPAHNSSWMLDCLTFVTHAVAVHICGSHRKAVKGASFLSVDPLVAACPPKQMSISAPQRLVVRGQVVSRRRSGGIASTSGSCKASWCVPPPPCSPTGLVPSDSKVFVAQSLGKAASAAFQLAREPAFRLAREAPVARRCLRKLPTVPTQGRQPFCISGGRKCSVPAPPTTPPSPWMHSLELILLTPDMHAHDVAMVSSASEACYEVASIADFTLQGTLRDFKVCSNSGGPVGALKRLGGSSYKRLSLLPQDPTRTRLPGQTTNFCQAARTLAVAYELQDPSTFLPLAFSYARITELPAVTSSLPVVALQSTPWLLQPPASMLCGVGPKLTGADCARAQGSKWAGIDAWACLLKQQVVKNHSNTLSRARMVQVSDQLSLRRSSCAAEVAAKALLSSRRSPLSSQQVSSRHLEIRGSSMTTTTTAKAVVVAGRCKSQKYLLRDLTSCLQSDFAHDAGLAVSEECKQLPALIKVYHRGCATARLIIKEVSIKKAPQIAAPVMPASHPCATRASVQQVTLALNCGKRSLAVKSPCRCLLPCHGGAATCCPGSKQLLTHAQGIFASTRSSATPVLCHLLSERLDTLPSAHAARVAHLHFRWAPISGVIEKSAENRAVRVRPCSVAPTCRVPLFSQVTRSYSRAVTGLSSRLLSGTRQLLLPSGTSRLLLPQASCARKITTAATTTTRKPILASGRMQARGMLLSTFAARFQVVVKSPTPPTTTATTTTATTTMSAEASRAPPKLLRSARFVAGLLGKQLQCSGQSSNKLQCSGKQLQCRDLNVHDNNIKLCLAMHLQPLPLLAASSFATAIPSVRCNNREVQQQLKSSSRCLINVVPDMPLRCRSSSTSAGFTCALGRESRHSVLGRSIGHASFVIAAPLQVRLALSGLKCSSSLATIWASAGRQLGSGSGLTITARAAQLPLGPRHGRAALPRVITPSHLAELAHDAGLASLGEGVRRQGWPAAGECKQSPLATRIRAAAATAAGGECTRAVRFSQRGCGKRAREVGTIFSCISQASSSLCRSSTGSVNLSYLPGPLVPGALQQATRDGCSRLCASSSGTTTTTGTAIATTMAVSSFEVTVRTATDEGADAQDDFVLPGMSLVSLETWRRPNAMPLLALPASSKAALQHAPGCWGAVRSRQLCGQADVAIQACFDRVTEQTRHGKALMLVKDGQVFSSRPTVGIACRAPAALLSLQAACISTAQTGSDLLPVSRSFGLPQGLSPVAAKRLASPQHPGCHLSAVSQAVAEAWPDGCKPASTHAAKGRILTFLLEEAFHDGLHPKLLRRSSEDRVRFEKSVAFSPQLLRVHSAAQVSTSRVFSLRSLGSSSCALGPRVVESSPEAQYLCSLPTRTAALSLPALQACGAKSQGFSCSCTGAGSSMACGGQGGQQVHCFSHLTTSLLQSPLPAVIASESADAQGDIGSEMTFCF
ncbi:unnamed protein product [Polarella glacialis]|uniref:Uncharacterized protein n=1 Tax=Polarella glacialis TaxID=89957 RepID=A0A813FDS3_POLGL|nr:unnamed protein product [Polarella glacialis]